MANRDGGGKNRRAWVDLSANEAGAWVAKDSVSKNMKRPLENQLLTRLGAEAQRKWRAEYDDYKLLLPEIKGVQTSMLSFAEQRKTAEELKHLMRGSIHRLRVFLPLLPVDTQLKLRRPSVEHSSKLMLMNLEDHVGIQH